MGSRLLRKRRRAVRVRPEGTSMIDPREFRTTLGHFATGVTVVTMLRGERVDGITVNAFMSVSLKPPLVAIAIDKRANAHQTLLESDRYGVSMLRQNQEALSNYFAGYPTDIVPAFVQVDGMPLVARALAHLVARITAQHDAGDHTIFVGEVEHLAYESGEPLLYYRGRYAEMAPDRGGEPG